VINPLKTTSFINNCHESDSELEIENQTAHNTVVLDLNSNNSMVNTPERESSDKENQQNETKQKMELSKADMAELADIVTERLAGKLNIQQNNSKKV